MSEGIGDDGKEKGGGDGIRETAGQSERKSQKHQEIREGKGNDGMFRYPDALREESNQQRKKYGEDETEKEMVLFLETPGEEYGKEQAFCFDEQVEHVFY